MSLQQTRRICEPELLQTVEDIVKKEIVKYLEVTI